MASLQVLCSSAIRRTNAVKSSSFKIFGYLEKRELITDSLLHVIVPLAFNTKVPKLRDLQICSHNILEHDS
jgi:hypothetical protein